MDAPADVSLCWSCQRRPADPAAAARVRLCRDGGAAEVDVPRCLECERTWAKVSLARAGQRAGWVMVVLFTLGMFLIGGGEHWRDTVPFVAVGAVLAGISRWYLGRTAARTKDLLAARTHPGVVHLIDEGYVVDG